MIALRNGSEPERDAIRATTAAAVRQANKRGAARLAAVQALYQMDVAGSGVFEITAEYEAFRLGKEVDGALYREADAQWFRAILAGVVENQKAVDPVIRQALTEDWPLSRLDSTLRAILRAGVYRTDEARATCRWRSSSRNMSTSPRRSTRKTSRSWSMPCSTACRAGCAARGAARTHRDGRRHRGRRRSTAYRSDPCRLAGDHRLCGADRHFHGRRWPAQYCSAPTSRWRRRRSPASIVGVALGALPAAAIIRRLGQRGGFMTGTVVTALGGLVATSALFQAVSGCCLRPCW